jgi:signal transduction histidine kinase
MHSHSTRIGYLGAATAIFLLVCGYFVSRSILDGFARIETQNMLSEVGWVIQDLEGEAVGLGDFANDVCIMPEAGQFISRNASEFISQHFDPITAEVMLFDFAVLFDAEHQFVAGVRYDSDPLDQSTLKATASRVLGTRIQGYHLEIGVAKIDLVVLESTVYLVASHAIYSVEQTTSPIVGSVMIGKRLPPSYEEFEGALGTTFSLVSRRDDSSWRGEGDRLLQDEVYPVFDDEAFFEEEDLEEFADWDSEELGDWEMIEFDLDLEIFEETQYYRQAGSIFGPDNLPKTPIMCSLGGGFSEAEIVMKILVPQTISSLARSKARLVTLSLWGGVCLTIGFTWFAVTEIRKRLGAENMLRSTNDELEQANAQKDRLFSIIGHDMRAPLNGVIRLSELMARAPDSFEAKDVARFANNINLTGKQLHGLLENLLNWARLQTGQLPFNPVVSDLSTVVRQAVSLYRPRAEEKGIELDIDVSKGMTVRADSEMLKTVLRNLMSNAIKFTGQKGSVSVSVSELHGFVRISVSDTGQGMSKDQFSGLFKLDVKTVNRSQPEDENGTGFGLLLCQEMLRRHESELEVYSDVGIGSEFSFSLPVA